MIYHILIYSIWYLVTSFMIYAYSVQEYRQQNKLSYEQWKIRVGDPGVLYIPIIRELLIILGCIVIVLDFTETKYKAITFNIPTAIDNYTLNKINKKIHKIIIKGNSPPEALLQKAEFIKQRIVLNEKKNS